MFNIDFDSDGLYFISHPRYREAAQRISRELDYLRSHFLIFSSGTTSGDLKGYALSREALLTNAKAVNSFFNLTLDDVWGLSLPHYHVGGLSVLARAYLLDSPLILMGDQWNPYAWSDLLKEKGVTITTIVPTQLFDLVKNNLKAPPKLKHLVVGGDYLSYELEKLALNLGWPVIRTFGMTEVSSQLASAKAPGQEIELLPIHEIKTDEDERLWVKSSALFTLQFSLKEKLHVTLANSLLDKEGFFPTNDRVSLEGKKFTHLGRLDDQIKVSGKLISLMSLKEKLYEFALKHNQYESVELLFEADDRLGKRLTLLHLPEVQNLEEMKNLFSPLKVELREVTSFNRTDLGKLKRYQSFKRSGL